MTTDAPADPQAQAAPSEAVGSGAAGDALRMVAAIKAQADASRAPDVLRSRGFSERMARRSVPNADTPKLTALAARLAAGVTAIDRPEPPIATHTSSAVEETLQAAAPAPIVADPAVDALEGPALQDRIGPPTRAEAEAILRAEALDPFGPPPVDALDALSADLSARDRADNAPWAPRFSLDDLDPKQNLAAVADAAEDAPASEPAPAKSGGARRVALAFGVVGLSAAALTLAAPGSDGLRLGLVSSQGVVGERLLDAAEIADRGLETRLSQTLAAVRLSSVIEGLPGELFQVKLTNGATVDATEIAANALYALPGGGCARRRVDLDIDHKEVGAGAVAVRRFGPVAAEPCPSEQVESPTSIAAVDNPQAGPAKDDPLVTGDLPDTLSPEALRTLLDARPVKCVDPAPADMKDRPRLPSGCAERTEYDVQLQRFTTVSPMEGGLRLEISGGLAIEGDLVCHLTRGLSALVIGDGMSDRAALDYERKVEARYSAIRGGRICYRFRSLGVEHTYGALGLVGGAPDPAHSDDRAFEMRTRG